MKKDFVPYDIAVKLKEKGFPMPTNIVYATYNQDGKLCPMKIVWETINKEPIAPTIEQVLKWLVEEKGVYVALDFFRINGDTELWWTYSVRYTDSDYIEDTIEICKRKSREQAALTGIYYALCNMI